MIVLPYFYLFTGGILYSNPLVFKNLVNANESYTNYNAPAVDNSSFIGPGSIYTVCNLILIITYIYIGISYLIF